jgi:hypothetical protein
MENHTLYNSGNPTPYDDNADYKREWKTPELIVETVASVTDGAPNISDDGLGDGS